MTDPSVPHLTAPVARRWALTLRAALAARRSQIDELNVFPVPDGDTGTNLYLTVDGALAAMRGPDTTPESSEQLDLTTATALLARSALLSARGNSGVILSQLVRGLAEVVAEADGRPLDAPAFARALRHASDLARASVRHPVEGTILSVASAAAGAAEERTGDADADLYAVLLAALAAAREALARTPEQLPALARAGVVDAGAAGYVLVLEALAHVLSGDEQEDAAWSHAPQAVAGTAVGDESRTAPAADPGGDAAGGGGPAYEVMYLLEDSTDDAVTVLREDLDRLGDSLIVVGGPDVWNVHVHVDDVGAALEAGVRAGRPHRITVTRFSDARTGAREHPARAHGGPPVAIVACAAGEGLARLFAEGGAHVVRSGPGRRASTGDLLAAARRTDAQEVVLLPCDPDTRLSAEAAARVAADEGLRLRVVDATSAVQGIAALAVFDPDGAVEDGLAAMRSAVAGTRRGAVGVADKEAHTAAGPCRPGDALGMLGDEVVWVGPDPARAGAEVVTRLLEGGGELLTVVTGQTAPEGLADAVAAAARAADADLEVCVVEGGQPVYPLWLGVE